LHRGHNAGPIGGVGKKFSQKIQHARHIARCGGNRHPTLSPGATPA
jgi:hypothetical protein